ncbi:MAG TPA: bifunctional UDP-3-O-[3-hydroxymyristoyl] N-acetylglucosamine deacetylase/3-hydroxyacyl-ACP dehydratase [Bacteroides sp.]|nr:bifunctional UDP-3-O-[3-hydroxymyristoyl] N-acetylglucosamine deacetylase/3-hydroxyacyl-ACP dehydratase [Bacteroides sp.]
MTENQKTIKKSISFNGRGLHTGVEVKLTLAPAPENHGYQFVRTDLNDRPVIRAIAENVAETSRGTTLEEKGVKVSTIEHVLAACVGGGIDNILIELNGPEAPILDGSSKEYSEAIIKTGLINQEAPRNVFKIEEKIEYKDEEHGIELIAYPDDKFSIDVKIDYNSKVLGFQYANLDNLKDFNTEIAPSRTFVFLHELEFLLKNNLIKGGDVDNAIVIIDRKVSQDELDRLATLFNKPKVKVQPEGILNNVDLNFSNEPARHKLLDILGDLALVGQPIQGKIIATRPGHYANNQFARLIRSKAKKDKLKKKAPKYDLNSPVLDINEIKKILPHRYPFLFVDKVLHRDEKTVVGVKNVTSNEPFFQGHFPQEPVMPGVLQVEAMAQVGGILVLNTVPDPEHYATYFLKIDNVKFKRKVLPGDTLVIKADLLEPIRRGIAHMFAQVFVGDNVVSEGELTAQIVKEYE